MNSTVLYQQLLQQRIAIAPSSLFRLDVSSQNFIRINCSFDLDLSMQHALLKVAYLIQHQSDDC